MHKYTIYISDEELRESEEVRKMVAAAAQNTQATLEKIATDTIIRGRVKDYPPNDPSLTPENKSSPIPTILAIVSGLLIFIAMAAPNFFN